MILAQLTMKIRFTKQSNQKTISISTELLSELFDTNNNPMRIALIAAVELLRSI